MKISTIRVTLKMKTQSLSKMTMTKTQKKKTMVTMKNQYSYLLKNCAVS